jgi:hypothetical protein
MQDIFRLGDVFGGILGAQMKIASVDGDYLVCHSWDGTSAGTADISVARPYLLRRTPFDGTAGRNSITYAYTDDQTRTATKSGEADITEVVTPSYVAGDIIYAAAGIRGGTDAEDDDAAALVWLDLNVDQRAWCESDA